MSSSFDLEGATDPTDTVRQHEDECVTCPGEQPLPPDPLHRITDKGEYIIYAATPTGKNKASLAERCPFGPLSPENVDLWKHAYPDVRFAHELATFAQTSDSSVIQQSVPAPAVIVALRNKMEWDRDTASARQQREGFTALDVRRSGLGESILVATRGPDIFLVARWTESPGRLMDGDTLLRLYYHGKYTSAFGTVQTACVTGAMAIFSIPPIGFLAGMETFGLVLPSIMISGALALFSAWIASPRRCPTALYQWVVVLGGYLEQMRSKFRKLTKGR